MAFKLQTGDTEFNTRVDALFSSLQSVAVDLKPEDGPGPQGTKRPFEEETSVDDIDDSDRGFSKLMGPPPPRWQGRGSRGKRGSVGPRNSTPDYIKNPQKWTKYSMKDTKVLNNRENAQVGLKLMADLQSRKEESSTSVNEETDEPEAAASKILFRKPRNVPALAEDEEASMNEETDVPQAAASKIMFRKPRNLPALADEGDIEDEGTEEEDCAVVADSVFGGTQKIRLHEYEVGKVKPKGKKKQAKMSEHLTETDSVDKKSGKEVKLGHLTYEDEEEPY